MGDAHTLRCTPQPTLNRKTWVETVSLACEHTTLWSKPPHAFKPTYCGLCHCTTNQRTARLDPAAPLIYSLGVTNGDRTRMQGESIHCAQNFRGASSEWGTLLVGEAGNDQVFRIITYISVDFSELLRFDSVARGKANDAYILSDFWNG